MSLLEVNQMKYHVESQLLLDIKKLEVHQTDRIGLVGRNGSGKTSLLNIMMGKLSPNQGSVTRRARVELIPQLKRMNTTKSGGEVTQEYIQQALNSHAGVLLVDEPTTNLDTIHIEWVEKKLQAWQGALVIVSHDRAFLDALCTTIWEVTEGKINEYKGHYSDYTEQKDIEKQQEQLAVEKYEREKRQLEEAIRQKEEQAQRATKKPKNLSSSEARIKGTKTYYANQQKKLQKTATAMKTRLENLDKVNQTKEIPPIKMNLPNEDTFKNRIILRVEEVDGKVGSRLLWEKAHFYVRGGEKIAVIGPNGSGKTTFIKKMINQDLGITLSPSVNIGYFAQNLTILDKEKSILENVKETSKQNETLIRTVLARMRFFDDDVYKPVNVLSGGERVKVALSKVFLSHVNMLVLDEPTNYLDIESLEALEMLLKEYEGTVIFITHDRQFIREIATRIIKIENGTITDFEGSYEEYQEAKIPDEKDIQQDDLLLLETKISEILSRLSVEPSEALEKEFQTLLKKKQNLEN